MGTIIPEQILDEKDEHVERSHGPTNASEGRTARRQLRLRLWVRQPPYAIGQDAIDYISLEYLYHHNQRQSFVLLTLVGSSSIARGGKGLHEL